jgi:cytochrome c553
MCFKENASMTTIESTPLNGGICNGKYTVNDMKAKGWSVDDIKISQTANGMNFIYILKTASSVQATPVIAGNQADMEARIIEKLEKKKVEEQKAKVEKELKDAQIDAQKIYTSKCQTCHGENGEKKAYNSSRPLKDLSLEDMEESIKDYKNGTKNSGNATIMAPYASFVDYKEIKGIHAYINKINNK